MRLFVNNCFIFINIRIWLVWNYIFSNTWIVWVLIFPILIFFMSIFSTPLFGNNLFWTAPASILLFPGVCSAGQPSAGWPKSSPGWENSCAALQPPLLPGQSPPAGQAKALLGPWVPPRTESSSRRRWLLPTQPPLSSPAPSSPSGGQPPSPSRWQGFWRGALPILAVAASCREEVPLPCSVKYMYMFWAFVNILSNLAERNTNLRIQSNLCCIIMKKSLTISSDHKFTW